MFKSIIHPLFVKYVDKGQKEQDFLEVCVVQMLLFLIVYMRIYCRSGGLIGFVCACVQLLFQRLCPVNGCLVK